MTLLKICLPSQSSLSQPHPDCQYLHEREGKERDYEREKETFLKETEVSSHLVTDNTTFRHLLSCCRMFPFILKLLLVVIIISFKLNFGLKGN